MGASLRSQLSCIIDEKGSQFSHDSIKEFLTSYRIQTVDTGKIGMYHIALEPTHTLLDRLRLKHLLLLEQSPACKSP